MWLVPRLFALMVYCAVLVIICCMLSRVHSRHVKPILIIYLLLLFLMGYLYVPGPGADVYRLIPAMHVYAEKTFSDIWEIVKESPTPGVPLYYCFVGKLNNDRLLSAISGLITFSFSFSLLYKAARHFDANKRDIAVVLYLFMSRGLFLQAISNIRTLLAISIFAWCVYGEFVEQQKFVKHIPLYAIAASLHAMGQALVLYRIVFLLFEPEKRASNRIPKTCLAIALSLTIVFRGRYILDALFQKAGRYYDGYQTGTGYTYIWETILTFFSILVMLYLLYVLYKSHRREKNNTAISYFLLVKFVVPLLGLNLISIFVEFNFFHRLGYFITYMCVPIAFASLSQTRLADNTAKVKNVLVFLSTIMLFIACARGDLCSLKFWE